jgi:DNA-binding transcriptional MerR regulator
MAYYPLNEFIKILEQKKCHVTRNKLRHYEREGLIKAIREKRGERDRWFYTEKDIDAVIAITNLISLSWKAKEVSSLLKLNQELKAVLNRMKEIKEMILASFQGTLDKNEEMNLTKEIEFLKSFNESSHTEFDIFPKMVEHYSSKKLDKKEIMINSLNMLDKMQTGVNVVSGYNKEIEKTKEDIVSTYKKIYDLMLDLYKK